MSLKSFHIFFVAIATLLSFGFAAWAWKEYQLTYASLPLFYLALGLVGGVGLAVYLIKIPQKYRELSYL
ncbi:MAG: hypothetical protein H7A33_03975 [Deltaproteobacteria bacterium]|nr:hypothetical protein [Deltaproteobacteria bacterium]